MPLVGSKEGYRLEEGYRLDQVVGGLTYPSNIEFGPAGELYVAEAGFTYTFVYTQARISRVDDDKAELVAEGFNGPLIGLKWHEGGFLATHRSTLTRVGLDGKKVDLVTDLPGYGDHHTNHIAVKDGKVYFGQGTVTNSGVVGPDNLLIFGWLVGRRDGHDTPPYDVTLTGVNFRSRNPFNPLEEVETGAFLPLGEKSQPGQVVKGNLKANGVVYRCNPDGSNLEVFAWGLRNPYPLTVDPRGRLLTIVQGEDYRGSRPMHAHDALYEVKQGAWYGWPDFSGGQPVTELMQRSKMDNPKGFVMQQHPEVEQPLHLFEEHSAAVAIDFSTSDQFGFKNQAFVAEFGSEMPLTTGGEITSAGHKIVRLDNGTMREEDFYVNTTPKPTGGGPKRPVMVKFAPDGEALYVVDHGIRMTPKTGAIYKISKV